MKAFRWVSIGVCAALLPVSPLRADPVDHSALPVSAEQLLPLEQSQGTYLVREGPEQGREGLVTLERRGGSWLLKKEGLAWHELRQEADGDIVVVRETDLQENQLIEYDPPVLLLPAVVDDDMRRSGTSRVTVRNARTGAVQHVGDCEWRLEFAGIHSARTRAGALPVYRFRSKRDIRFALADCFMRIDFDYSPGKGIVVTGMDQRLRFAGFFGKRVSWRLEQLPA